MVRGTPRQWRGSRGAVATPSGVITHPGIARRAIWMMVKQELGPLLTRWLWAGVGNIGNPAGDGCVAPPIPPRLFPGVGDTHGYASRCTRARRSGEPR